MPNMMTIYLHGEDDWSPFCGPGDKWEVWPRFFADSTMIHCQLVNATYHTAFDYTNGRQNVTILSLEGTDQDEPLTMVNSVWGPPTTPTPGSKWADPDCAPLNEAGHTCIFDPTILSTLSYQAILQAFNNLIVGLVYNSGGYDTAPTFKSTSIQYTSLVKSSELRFLTKSIVGSSYASQDNLQQAITLSNSTLYQGLLSPSIETSTMPLIRRIEELFQNIVVSMMSAKELQ